MAICCNPASIPLYFTQTFPKELIGQIEHGAAGRMRIWAALISANSNWDDLAGFAVEGNNKKALESYDKAFVLYKSERDRIEKTLANMPAAAAEFSTVVERKLKEEISNLGLDRAGLDYKAFFARQLLELQSLVKRVDTLLALESCGRELVQKGDFLAFDRLMVESIRALSEIISKNLGANVAASRLFGEFSLLITREIQKSTH